MALRGAQFDRAQMRHFVAPLLAENGPRNGTGPQRNRAGGLVT
jgi:hypothetical protein